MPNYVLSPQAQNSLKQISRYTTEKFGEQQKKKYIKLLRDKMRGAANSPYKGQKRSEIKEGYHSIRAICVACPCGYASCPGRQQ